MTYYTVYELTKIAAGWGDTIQTKYELPTDIKTMLIELESCLEITDAVQESTSVSNNANAYQKKHFSSSTRFSESDNSGKHYRKDGRIGSVALGSKHRKESTGTGEWTTKGTDSNRKSGGIGDSDWELMRSFKATKIETKTGIEKTVNDIRVALNKMSSANYEKQKDAVLEYVNGYFDGGEVTDEDTRRISKAIFEIASTNKFYSEIYARLYGELIGTLTYEDKSSPDNIAQNTAFRVLLDEFVERFTDMTDAPVYVDPDKDYDGFCVYSKACDTRKSTSTFLVNCFKIGLVTSDQINTILRVFLEYVNVNKKEDGYSKLIEEVIENVYIIATLCQEELSGTTEWKTRVLNAVKELVAEKNEGYASFSSRASFKCMDLLQKI